jgi:hypothetical protein
MLSHLCHQLIEHPQHVANIRVQTQVHGFDFADFLGVHINVDNVSALGKLLDFAGDAIVKTGEDKDDDEI